MLTAADLLARIANWPLRVLNLLALLVQKYTY
jgi:hypothetical protein